jgi:O-antigen/teichoic acid export membrane protein
MILTRLRDPHVLGIGVYAGATAVSALLTLLLTRVLWQALTPADFGIWALVDPLLLPLASLLLLGIDHAIVKQLRMDQRPPSVVTGALLLCTLPVSGLGLLMIGVIAQYALHLNWTQALLLTLAGEALLLMVQTAFRAAGTVWGFATVLVTRNLLYLAGLLVVTASGSARPLSLDVTFLLRGGCVLGVGLIAVIALHPSRRLDWSAYRDAVSYGLPLLLTTFLFAVGDLTDRWALATFAGVVEVGTYALHLKVAAILSQAIVIPFGLWFPPERFRHMDDADGGHRFFIRTSLSLALICGLLAGGIWLARDPVLSLIAPGVVASPLIMACCLGAVVCLALSQALNVGLLLPGHTSKNAICSGVGMAVTAVASVGLVPVAGAAGAALGRLLGGLVLLTLTAMWSHRVLAVHFAFTRLLGYFVTSALALLVIDQLTPHGLRSIILALVAWTVVTPLCGLWLRPYRQPA